MFAKIPKAIPDVVDLKLKMLLDKEVFIKTKFYVLKH